VPAVGIKPLGGNYSRENIFKSRMGTAHDSRQQTPLFSPPEKPLSVSSQTAWLKIISITVMHRKSDEDESRTLDRSFLSTRGRGTQVPKSLTGHCSRGCWFCRPGTLLVTQALSLREGCFLCIKQAHCPEETPHPNSITGTNWQKAPGQNQIGCLIKYGSKTDVCN